MFNYRQQLGNKKTCFCMYCDERLDLNNMDEVTRHYHYHQLLVKYQIGLINNDNTLKQEFLNNHHNNGRGHFI